MFVRTAMPLIGSARRNLHHAALLAGVSALALLGHARPAEARQLGYSGAFSATIAASDAAQAASQQAAAMAKQAQSALTRATQALQAMQAVQNAARAAASTAPTSVTNGLSAGGLIVDPRIAAGTANLWVNANLPTQSSSGGQTTVTVQQTSQRAIMTWQQFNVGKNTLLNFDQSGGDSANGNSWVALNRIDATGVPSQILGSITAQGTVLIINPNGIIFTGTSQINVHSLIASSMDINSFAGNGAGNAGVFNSSGSYTSFSVNGANFMAPSNEDSGNTAFLNSGLYTNGLGGNAGGTLVFSAGGGAGINAGIQVLPGASISTNVSGFDNGGMVALVGPQVNNAGSVETAAGQIVLAAGSNVLLTAPASGSTQTSFIATNALLGQGLVYQAAAVPGGAFAVNDVTGILTSTRGNITLVGDSVEQLGFARVTTSITRAGSITITATGASSAGLGNTIFGPGSITTILPDENGETIPSDATSLAAFVAPHIDIATTNLDMQPNSLILAPGANMTVTSAPILSNGTTPPPLGRVLLEDGSEINLAGLTGVTRSVTDTLYTFKVTANDVADSPLAQGLIGQTVTIDLSLTGTRADGETWVGSPLFASSGAGYLANIPQNIDQLLTKGGSLSIGGGSGSAFIDALTASGSVVNVSGGWIQYTGGTINTTRLVGSDGRLYDIGSADPFISNRIANGFVVDHAHWGVTETWSSSLLGKGYYKQGYIDGVSAGGLAVSAVNPVLQGDIVGDIVTGLHQLALGQTGTGANGAQATPDQMPNGASLTVNLKASDSNSNPNAVVLAATASDVLGSNVTLTSPLSLPATIDGLPTVTYSTNALSVMGLGSITISGASDLSMEQGASLSVLSGGSIKLSGATTIDGTLTARGGSISITGFVPSSSTALPVNSTPLTIGSDALIDVSGLWVNDSGLNGAAFQGSAYINGGSASITTNAVSKNASLNTSTGVVTAEDATQSIVVAAGSVIDVSSGGYVGANSKLALGTDGLPKGNGGSVSLVTYAGSWLNNRNLDSLSFAFGSNSYAPTTANTATVTFDGTIYAGGLSSGGTFALQAPGITIDGNATNITSITSGARAGTVMLPASFFTGNGFSNYNLTSTYGDVTVTAGATVALQQNNYLLSGTTALAATGASLRDFAGFGLAPDGQRHLVNLTLTEKPYIYSAAAGASTTAGIVINTGASIVADPQAAITLTAGGAVTVLGSIIAPAGSIALSSDDTALINPGVGLWNAAQDVWIGANAVLDVSGVFVPDPKVTAYASGTALDAGAITIASDGAIVALSGSRFNLEGTSATIEVPGTGGVGGPRTLSQKVWSDGGTLTLSSNGQAANPASGRYESLYFAGTINAAGGAPQASGGTLNIGSIVSSNDVASVAGYGNIIIARGSDAQSGDMSAAFTGASAPATAVQLAALLPNTGSVAFITANTINTAHSGLDSVSLTGPITFSGNVNLNFAGALYLNGSITLAPTGITPNSNASAYASTVTASGIATIGATNVELDAGYIRFLSGVVTVPTLADGTLTLNASAQIDLAGVASVSNAGQVKLVSGGDIRFLPTTDPDISTYLANISVASSTSLTRNGNGGLPSPGALLVADNLTLTAREIYPATDTAFLLMSLGLAPGTATGTHNTITFASNGATPSAPLSANGAILVDAKNIVQGGALYAPLGTIQLGYGQGQTLPAIFLGNAADTGSNPYDPVGNVDVGAFNPILASLATTVGPNRTVATQNVTLTPDSLASVSAAGLSIPYGTTVDGTNWSDGGLVLNGPPAKLIVLGGASVNTQSGAVIDERGGGDVYATEFVPGTGGSRNVLATPNTYALVPSFEAKVAAYDPSFGNTVAPGTSVTLPGGNGIAAGTYTLMPAMYATLPGAYRVVVTSTNAGTTPVNSVGPDGTITMSGLLGNAIDGSRSSQTALLQIQSNATWTKYSEIDIASGNSYFAALAATNGTVTPRLAIDAGQLVVAAANALTLDASNLFAPGTGGRGGQLDIAGTNMLVVASDLRQSFASNSAYNGYLFVDADQISNLGVESVLIGGTRTSTAAGTLITATAKNLEVDTDAAHALSAPDLLLVSLAPTSADGSRGLVVGSGSVITAKGSVSTASADPLVIGVDPVALHNGPSGALSGYTAGVSGDGSLLRVSNGGIASVTRNFVPGLYTPPATTPTATGPVSTIARGSLSIGSGVILSGNALTLDSSGTTTIATDAVLTAKNYDLSANIINLGGGSGGLVLSPSLLASFAGADTVSLRSASVFNFYGNSSLGSSATPIGTLTLDGSGFTSDGGTTTITATNIAFVDNQATPNNNGANTAGAGGSLIVDASGTVSFGAGAKALNGFGNTTFTAGQQILFTGSGSLDAKGANVILTAPALVANAGSSQSLVTTGALTIQQGAGTAPTFDPANIGGALTLTAAGILDSGTIVAQAGKLTLEATTGDVTIDGNANINAAGTRISLFDLTEDTPGGTVKLIADAGNVTLGANTLIDVSAAGNGYAGTLGIQATNGTATLGGTLKGSAAYNDLGGNFLLVANNMAGSLPLTNFTGGFAVSLGNGDINIANGQTLTSQNVLLVANNGSVNVAGTIDASGPSGGTIALYGTGTTTDAAGTAGATGVTIGSTAKLYARYQADDPNDPAYANGASANVQRGGTITLGTTGTPDTVAGVVQLNTSYGYQNVSGSGAITVASGAIFDVSGGPGDTTGNIDNTGGSVIVRAPILTNNNINVSFKGTLVTNAKADGVTPSGNGIVADAFAVWSTTDASSVQSKHFDGIIDPAGWYNSTGTLLPGTFTNAAGTTVATWSGTTLTNSDGTTNNLSYYLTNAYFAPTAANADHQTFYGYVDGAQASGAGTLMGFVQNPFSGNDAAVQANFADAKLQVGTLPATVLPLSSMLHVRPEIDLVNLSGDISVLTNWNLGAVKSDGTLAYRHNGEAPVLAIRADGDVTIKASITDGFTETAAAAVGAVTTVLGNTYTNALGLYNTVSTTNTTDINAIIGCETTTCAGLIALGFDVSVVPSAPVLYTSLNSGYTTTSSDYYYYVYGSSTGQYEFSYNYYIGHINTLKTYFKAVGLTLAATTAANTTSAIFNNAQTALQALANANQAYSLINSSNSAYTNLSHYAQYLSYYSSYLTAWYNWASASGVRTTYGVGTLPSAPQAVPLLSVTAGAVSTAQADNSPSPIVSVNNKSPVSAMNLAFEASSTSYRIVAGAMSDSVNPLAFNSSGNGSITIDEHISYADPQTIAGTTHPTISIGNVVRTGTGSIDIAAADGFSLADATAPGAVYTAGTATTTPSDFSAPSLTSAYTGNPNGLVSTPTWAVGGGSITIAVGGDIVGGATSGDTNWTSWYYHLTKTNGNSSAQFSGTDSHGVASQQTAAWVNYATYADGIGALGGGNVTLTAGGNIKDAIVSLPQTLLVSGGTTAVPVATEHTYGGGNLLVKGGSDIIGSAFLVGDGTGTIRIGAAATADSAGNGLGLAVQEGVINLVAGGAITLGGIYDPAMLNNGSALAYTQGAALPDGAMSVGTGPFVGSAFNSYGADSGISVISIAGDVTVATNTLGSLTLPASLAIDAVSGSIQLNSSLNLIPSAIGTLTLLAGDSISTQGLNYAAYAITMLDGTAAPANPLGMPTPAALSSAVHANDDVPVIIYAGRDIIGSGASNSSDFVLIKQAKVQAGRDIINVNFTGQNNNASDITSIIVGRDIQARQFVNLSGQIQNTTSLLKLYGPGDFLVEAGRNLGPFTTYDPRAIAGNPSLNLGGGILAVGDGSNSSCGSACTISYLPVGGANITTLFGVGPGIDVAAAIANYIDPAKAGTGGISYLSDIANILGVSQDHAWATFQTLPPARQKLLVERAFLDFLTQVNLDYSNPVSPYHGQYARAYQTIATLFPASLGYTDNNSGGSNGASLTVHTGDLRMAHSLIETQTGGDINILGPGGNAFVGSNSADTLTPAQQGILTLQGGSIRSYTDGSVEVFQSRIFTEQGGNVELFSANGDLNAGKGPKSSSAFPPLRLVCDVDGYCRVSPAGLVTGAGVGALLSVPGQDPLKSNVVLSAPHGTVDAGAAGIRSANDLNIVALQILNAFNIQVGGVTTGIPFVAAPNIGALTTASNATAATQQATLPAQTSNSDRPSIIIVEVLGYGGGSSDDNPQPQDQRRKDNGKQSSNSYDSNNMIRLLGNGSFTAEDTKQLTVMERDTLTSRVVAPSAP